MSRRTVIVIAIALGCSQTNTTRHYHLDVAQGFSLEQSQAIFDAAAEWQTSSDAYVTFDGQYAGNDVIVVHPATPDQLVAEFGGGTIGYNETSGTASTISIVTSLDPQTFHQTALHELGHALGLIHTTPGTIMCANTTCATLEVTCGDLEQLAHYHVPSCFP